MRERSRVELKLKTTKLLKKEEFRETELWTGEF